MLFIQKRVKFLFSIVPHVLIEIFFYKHIHSITCQIKSNQIKYRLLQSIEDCLNNVITLYNNIDAKGLREASLLKSQTFY